MQQAVIAVLVVVMMLAIGLRTTPADFLAVWRSPRAVGLSLLINIVVAPLLAVGLLRWASFPSAISAGILICAVSPGGPAGALFAAVAGGHLATAVISMVSLSLLSVLTAPLTLSLAMGVVAASDASQLVLPIIGTLALFQMAPLLVGLGLRVRRPQLAERLSGPLGRIANGLLLLVILGLLLTKWAALREVGVFGILFVIVLVGLFLLLGAGASASGPTRRSLSMISGVHNISLALLISATWIKDPLTDASILTFGLFTMLVPFIVARSLSAKAPARKKSVDEK